MAKIKRDDPLFLEFVNYPIITREYVETENYKGIGHDDSEVDDKSKMKNRVNYFFKQLIKKGNLSSDYSVILKKEMENINGCSKEYIDSIFTSWFQMYLIIRALIRAFRSLNYKEALADLDRMPPLLGGVVPVLRFKDTSGLVVELKPPRGEDPSQHSDFAAHIYADFVNFIVKDYKPGIFAFCKLDRCVEIIITANGRKYCCPYHSQKACLEAKKKNLEYSESKKIRDKLRKRFDRHPHKHTMNREGFIRKNWDPDKLHLYRSPRSPK